MPTKKFGRIGATMACTPVRRDLYERRRWKRGRPSAFSLLEMMMGVTLILMVATMWGGGRA